MKKKNTGFYIILAILVVLGLGFLIYPSVKPGPTNLGPFASCLKDKGVAFYGAFWCPHCAAQKKLFGNAVDLLPYVECSNPDESQTQICIDKGIQSYPTWVFPDGSRNTGETSLQTLADKSGCTLPAQ
ncbi:MAG: hypothetical protein KGJ89_02710 [Patescibacteria group bacterium]|nr:hypothetical protein [Patescibacteria group bacterium]MDE2015790.1 hypothetical protein [Patescibacteria group bacterium]MDE2226847.1 hypothetical protein [Patescibacteria group bacterium]